jgi:protease I
MPQLDGKKVAIVVADGFEQVEMTEPRKALEEAGAKTEIVSPAKGKVKGWKFTEWGDQFRVDVPIRAGARGELRCAGAAGRCHESGQVAPPDDIPAFNRKMIEEFQEGAHRGQRRPAREEHPACPRQTKGWPYRGAEQPIS